LLCPCHVLGMDQPFYLLSPYPLETQRIPPTIEEIAAEHIRIMRTVQPEGPYLFAGWCNGGLVAYEMARQLLAAGQQIDLLILMEPMTQIYPPRLRRYHAFINRLGAILGLDQGKRFALYCHLKQDTKHAVCYLRSSRYRKGLEVRIATAQDMIEDYAAVFDWIAMHYKLEGIYPGKLLFFWSSSQTYRFGWQEAEKTHKAEVVILPGDHVTCRTDYRKDLAGY